MDLSISDMNQLIYNKINIMHSNNDYNTINNIYKFVNDNNIPRTKNSNGIFINLSVIDPKYTLLLYNFTQNYQNNIIIKNNNFENKINQYKTILSDSNSNISHSNISHSNSNSIPINYKNLIINNLEKSILSFAYS